jgi:hypothetical protein
MLDNAAKWPPEPQWRDALLRGRDIEARSLLGLSQLMVSGDLAAFAQRFGLPASVGALGLARGDRYAVRLARDRIAVVGVAVSEAAPGWHAAGYAVTPMSAALHVLEFRGAALADLIARATRIDPRDPGPSASVVFAGVTSCLYFYENAQTLRLHFDRGLSSYVWSWLQAQPLFTEGVL